MVDEFCLKLKDIATDCIVELTFHLPPRYPHLEPLSVYVRCSNLDGQQSCLLNAAVRKYIEQTLPLGEPQVTDVVAWIRDHFQDFSTPTKSDTTAQAPKKPVRFERMWLYSHHIYSTVKRKNIVTLANDLALTGFSMPGKPGIICVEGDQENCQQFWNTIRTWSWKKLVIRHQETLDIESNIQQLRKFGTLKEVAFDARHCGGREFHMDMAGFNKYLIEHDCAAMFHILFGLECAD